MPGGPTLSQVAPRLTVRRTVPRLPLVHTIRSLTADRPRSRAAEPVGVSCQSYEGAAPDANPSEVAARASAAATSGIRILTLRNLTGRGRTWQPGAVEPGARACSGA